MNNETKKIWSIFTESKVGDSFGGVPTDHPAHHGPVDVHQTFVDRRALWSHRVPSHGVPVLPHCQLLIVFLGFPPQVLFIPLHLYLYLYLYLCIFILFFLSFFWVHWLSKHYAKALFLSMYYLFSFPNPKMSVHSKMLMILKCCWFLWGGGVERAAASDGCVEEMMHL